MTYRTGLQGIRIHLSGSIPKSAADEQAADIALFVEKFAKEVFRQGGTIVHGSHPTFEEPLRSAAAAFVTSGGPKDVLTLVRAQQFAESVTDLDQIEAQRDYAVVHVVPRAPGNRNQSLVPLREWMAERCDAIVAIGGDHWDVNQQASGVTFELEELLERGKPGFLLGGFGGAAGGYAKDRQDVFSRLRNGLPLLENQMLAVSTAVDVLVDRVTSQLQLLPLFQESVSRGRSFRILALDGGGLRGTFTAAVLAKWDEMLKKGGGNRLVEHFDLVAGTSTGAILAIGLAVGLTPLEMLKFYKTKGPTIFPQDRKLRHWLKSKHESQTLAATLRSILGEAKLSEAARVRLVLPTVRAIHGQSEAIVTAHSRDRTGFEDISCVDAALASSAAPSYFDEAFVEGPVAASSYLDGGIWANNPVLPAIAEAVRFLKVPLDRLDVLSVGTLGSEADFTEALGKGKLGWAPSSADLFFAAQEHGAETLATNLLGNSRLLRVNQQTPTGIKLDDATAISDMALRGSDVGQDTFVAVRSRFLDGFHIADWRSEPRT